ncbi:protease [Pseudoxanthomonas kalamensis DSM 18571]|uniref:S8 family peptidase n=1 Tax=Pseudoxanthomonas kalamensis TaxID=289483 RepID=UPI001390DCBE|nr:S8 family peptidase [Pseudoxanthomonas kalamensis]KAF1708881.1 protease [Pseudoxanthomonas kalamensis DSM 18571]
MKMLRNSVLATVVIGVLSATPAFAAKPTFTRADPPRVNLGGIEGNQMFGRFIVTYRDGSTSKNNRTAITRNSNTALTRAGLAGRTNPASASYMRKLATGSDLIRLSRKLDRAEAEAFMRQIAADPNVASVSLDVLRRPVRDIQAPAALKPMTFDPSDTYYGNYQWHLKAPDGATTAEGNANDGGSNVNNAWDLADGNGIVIAVLDTGITSHVDIDTSLADAGYDFITDSFVSGRATDGRVPGGWDLGDWTTEEPWLSECTDAFNPPSESSWHGTHVASTAGAELTDNALGMAGIAYNAKILPVRVLGHCGGYDSDINDAIVWSAGGHVDGVPDNANPAQVINLSLGGGGSCPASDPQAQAIAMANSLGAVVVVSAGNSGADAANYSPASCPGAVTVASTGITSRRAYYSNYGATVEIAAPGGGIYANDGSSGTVINDGFVWQALNSGTTTPVENATGYSGYAGTSQAAPHVSGVVALMQGARLDAGLPLLTPDEVLSILQSTAHAPSVTPPSNRAIGAGIVDAAAAVTKAIEPPCTEDCGPTAIPLTNKVVVSGLSGAAGSEALYSFDAAAGAKLTIMTYGGSGDVSVYVALDREPTTSDYDAKSTRRGNSETVRVNRPTAGTYYIKLVGAGAYSGVSLVARQ